jgi:hypothetical protein
LVFPVDEKSFLMVNFYLCAASLTPIIKAKIAKADRPTHPIIGILSPCRKYLLLDITQCCYKTQ